jgi:uncharacterized membrane protein
VNQGEGEAMRHSVEGVQKWRTRAIFDFRKTKITVFDEKRGSREPRKIPEDFLQKPLSKIKRPEKVALQRLSLPEILSGASAILSLVIFVYIRMFQLEVQSQESISQLNIYAALSLLVTITFLITFASLMILRRVFPGET